MPKNKPWFRVENVAGQVPAIYIYDIIGDKWWEDDPTVSCTSFVESLNNLAKDHKRIDVRINCPGGSVFHGMAIINAIAQSTADIYTYVDGIAYSMGAMIALAGKKVFASSMSRFMLHTVLSYAYGNARDLRSTADELDGYSDTLAQLVVDKTGLTLEEVNQKWFNHDDHYFNPDEMLANKLVDEIIKVKPSAQNYAAMDFKSAMDFFTMKQEKADGEEIEIPNPTNQKPENMKFKKVNALLDVLAAGNVASKEVIDEAQAELNAERAGLIIINAADNRLINEQRQLIADIQKELGTTDNVLVVVQNQKNALAEIKALFGDKDPITEIKATQALVTQVTACFEGTDKPEFNLLTAVQSAVADAKEHNKADGDGFDRTEDSPEDVAAKSKAKKDADAMFTNHFKEVASKVF